MMSKSILILCIISLCVSNSIKAMNLFRSRSYSLYEAAARGKGKQVSRLIEGNADINQPDNNGETPLHKAVWNGHKNVVKILLAHNANVNQPDNDGGTPLHSAAKKGRKSMAKLLLDNNANVNQFADETIFTPLHDAVFCRHKGVVKILLRYNADVNQPDNDGKTPLHGALCYSTSFLDAKCNNIIEVLLRYNADVNQPDNDGRTPLHGAVSHIKTGEFSKTGGYFIKDIFKILLRHNADVTHPDKEGITPLHMAVSKIASLNISAAPINEFEIEIISLKLPGLFLNEEEEKKAVDIVRLLLRYVPDLHALNPQDDDDEEFHRLALRTLIKDEIDRRNIVMTH